MPTELARKPGERPASLRLIEELLRRGAPVMIRATGRSMLPFLRGDESLTLQAVVEGSLRLGDLIFARSSSGGYFLHRVVGFRRETGGEAVVQTKGDGLPYLDAPVSARNVLGRVARVERRGASDEILDLGSVRWRVAAYVTARRQLAWLALRRVSRRLRETARRWLSARSR